MSRAKDNLFSGIVTIAVAAALLAILWPHETNTTGTVQRNGQPVQGYVIFREIDTGGRPFGEVVRADCQAGKYSLRLPNGCYEMRAFYESGEPVGTIGKPVEVGPFWRRHDFHWQD